MSVVVIYDWTWNYWGDKMWYVCHPNIFIDQYFIVGGGGVFVVPYSAFIYILQIFLSKLLGGQNDMFATPPSPIMG